MNNRKAMISHWIENRKKNGEKPTPCILHITTPQLSDCIIYDKAIKKVIEILEKYQMKWNTVDTVPGSFNLDREWLEVTDVNCFVEYCGCYPTEWDLEDVVQLEKLENEGKIVICVTWHVEGKYIPNH